MTTHYQGKTFRKHHHDAPNAQMKQLENDYIEKLTIAQNIFHRIKHYTSELEILISGVIKVYCGAGFSEKGRIDFLLKNIQNEIADFDNRIKLSEVIEQYDIYPEDLIPQKPTHLFNESLMSSTRSDQIHMLAIKNEVKDLISDYKEAVDKLKEENKTIQALVAERKHHHENDDYSDSHNKENISYNVPRSPKYGHKDRSLDESERSPEAKDGGEKKVSKYAELSRFINDLNKKKEENMRKLATIETRLATIRKTTTDEDKGVLKTSDLNRDEERPLVAQVMKKQSSEREVGSRVRDINADKKDYANYMREVTELSQRKRSHKGDENGHDSKLRSKRKEPASVHRSKKSHNDSNILETEIDQLNKEIDTIKGLLDSAIIQKKYQNK